MSLMRRKGHTDTVIAAVMALVLHTIVAGFSAGALAATPVGIVICTPDGSEIVPEPTSGHQHQQECCLSGCPVVTGSTATSTAIAFPPAVTLQPGPPASLAVGPGDPDDRSPVNPRAPPSNG